MAILPIEDALLREPNLWVPGKKPVGPVKIDWEHPITANLAGIYLLNSPAIHNLVTGAVTTMPATEGVIVRGNAYFERATGAADGHFIDLYSDSIMPAGTIMLNNFGPSATTGWIFAEIGEASEWSVNTNIPNNRFQSAINGSIWYDQPSHTELTNDNSILSWSWDVDANTERHISTTARTTRSVSISQPTNAQIKIGARFNYDDLQAGTLYYMYFWNRFITDAEETAIRNDPYQILMPA